MQAAGVLDSGNHVTQWRILGFWNRGVETAKFQVGGVHSGRDLFPLIGNESQMAQF